MDFLIEGQCNTIFPICRSGFAKYNNRKSIKYINNTTNKGSTASAHSLVQLFPFMAQIHDVIVLKWIKHKLIAKMFVPTPRKTPGRGSYPETPDRY